MPEFRFADGETMRGLRLHYVTLGTPRRDARGRGGNAVLVLHGTGGDTNQFLSDRFAGVCSRRAAARRGKYFIVLPDGIGHGKSSKPSDGLHADSRTTATATWSRPLPAADRGAEGGPPAPGDGHLDGRHATWVWGETYPDFMDALLPLASLPVQIAGRNRSGANVSRRIRSDPDWRGGDYTTQPRGLPPPDMLLIIRASRRSRQKQVPTRDAADAYSRARRRPLSELGTPTTCSTSRVLARLRPQPKLEQDPGAAARH